MRGLALENIAQTTGQLRLEFSYLLLVSGRLLLREIVRTGSSSSPWALHGESYWCVSHAGASIDPLPIWQDADEKDSQILSIDSYIFLQKSTNCLGCH